MPRLALPLIAAATLSLAGCMDPAIGGAPLTGDALEARLSGQVMTIRPVDTSLGTPVRAELYDNGTVRLTYGHGGTAVLPWKVETQGLCFPFPSEPSRFSCRNIVISDGNRFTIYDTRGGSERIATGTLTPM